MPILDLQQRITERGRIRLGTKVEGTRKDGSTYTRPAKSKTFLVSSQDRTVVETAAQEWADTCGVIEPFQGGFRVDTGRTELDVILPPEMMSFSQWREMWGNGYCARRCDGQRETISDGPCLCPPDHEERRVLAAKGKACKDTTRLSVMLPDLPGFGLWRVESHGFYAATELAGAVQAVTHLAPNTLVRARLTAVAREVVRFDADGNPKTHKFVVPTLDLPDVRLRELIAPDGGVGVAISAPSRPAGLTPVAPAALESGAPSIAEQLTQTAETPRRKNAAAVLPPTGLRPGQGRAGQSPSPEGSSSGGVPATAPEAARPEHAGTAEVVPTGTGGERQSAAAALPPDAVEPGVSSGPDRDGGVAAPVSGDAPASAPVTASTGNPNGYAEQDPKRFAGANRKARALAATALSDDKPTATAQWEGLVWAVSGGTTTESKHLTVAQHNEFTQRLKELSAGTSRLVESDRPDLLGWDVVAGSSEGTAA